MVRGSDPRKVSLAKLVEPDHYHAGVAGGEIANARRANVSQLLQRAVVKRRNRQVPSRFADFINHAIKPQSEKKNVSRFAH